MTVSKHQWKKYTFKDGTMVVTYHKELRIAHYVWEWRHESGSASSHTMFVLSVPEWLTKGMCISPTAKKLMTDCGQYLAESMVLWCKSLGRQIYVKDASNIATPIALVGEPKEYMMEDNLLKT